MTGRHLRVFHRDYYDHEVHDGDIDPHRERSEDLDCEPDEYDRDDGLDAVDLAVAALNRLEATEPSGWPDFPGPHCWWGGTVTLDYYTGETRETSAHPHGFSDAECREIWARLTGAPSAGPRRSRLSVYRLFREWCHARRSRGSRRADRGLHR